ncbi:hypothetical protein KKD52_01755 [Myxococcota bacterium]|nr:hypothetical protein [Myxococcota bacterium]MBU1410982.1 hypothetical protein [Myxococcota bacterium]MBU1509058.1 hypothetical protein [Myxococcota bacterium]
MKNSWKIVSTASLVLGLMLGVSACKNSDKKDADPQASGCAKMYDKFFTCSKELDEERGMAIKDLLADGKDKFVAACKKDFEKAKKMVDCAEKSTCGEFFKCAIGMDPTEAKKAADVKPAP